MNRLVKFTFIPITALLISTLTFSCKSDTKDSSMDAEAASERIEEVQSEVYPELKNASDYSLNEAMNIDRIGMNDKGYIWMITDIIDQDIFPTVDGYEVKYNYNKKKGNLTMTLPDILEGKTNVTLQLFNKLDKTKSKKFPLKLNFEIKNVTIADEK